MGDASGGGGGGGGGGGAKADMRCLGAGEERARAREREREFAQFFGAYSERGAGMRCAQYFRVSGDAGERERERRSGGFGRERNS